MTKVTLANVGSLIDATTAQTTINNNSAAIVAAVENTLSRDGTSPNQMGANLDMNSHRILNLPIPVQDSEPLRLGDLTDFTQFQNSVDLAAAVASASASATTATTQATNASISATAASGFATAASASAVAAALSVSPMKKPEDFGAVGDGVTNDAVALQAWADSIRDGGVGMVGSTLGYATSATITFMPSTNVAPVQGPIVLGNLKLVGTGSLPLNADLLRIWNPTAVGFTQNFYSPRFDSIEVSNTTGTGVGVSVRGFWGSIGKIFGRDVQDALQFPLFTFGGIPDTYESMCTIGDVSSIGARGYTVNNQISIGASPTFHNIRGTVSNTITTGLGAINASGGEQVTGAIAYTGLGWACTIDRASGFPVLPHEIYMQGCGDIDAAENGFKIKAVSNCTITGHRLNIEPPGFAGVGPSYPLVAYSLGDPLSASVVLDTTVNCYITIRPGVTLANIGTLFDFNNDFNIGNLTINASIADQTVGAVILAGAFGTRYKNINPSAKIKIIENGVVLYDNTNFFTVAQLPPAAVGLRGVRKMVTDSNTSTFGAVVAGGGGNIMPVVCNGTNWIVG